MLPTLNAPPGHAAMLLSAGLGTFGQQRCFNLLMRDKIVKQEVSLISIFQACDEHNSKVGLSKTLGSGSEEDKHQWPPAETEGAK